MIIIKRISNNLLISIPLSILEMVRFNTYRPLIVRQQKNRVIRQKGLLTLKN